MLCLSLQARPPQLLIEESLPAGDLRALREEFPLEEVAVSSGPLTPAPGAEQRDRRSAGDSRAGEPASWSQPSSVAAASSQKPSPDRIAPEPAERRSESVVSSRSVSPSSISPSHRRNSTRLAFLEVGRARDQLNKLERRFQQLVKDGSLALQESARVQAQRMRQELIDLHQRLSHSPDTLQMPSDREEQLRSLESCEIERAQALDAKLGGLIAGLESETGAGRARCAGSFSLGQDSAAVELIQRMAKMDADHDSWEYRVGMIESQWRRNILGADEASVQLHEIRELADKAKQDAQQLTSGVHGIKHEVSARMADAQRRLSALMSRVDNIFAEVESGRVGPSDVQSALSFHSQEAVLALMASGSTLASLESQLNTLKENLQRRAILPADAQAQLEELKYDAYILKAQNETPKQEHISSGRKEVTALRWNERQRLTRLFDVMEALSRQVEKRAVRSSTSL